MDMRLGVAVGFFLLALCGGPAMAAATLPEDANTTCPVMTAEPADPELFVEHNGRTIYVCCTKCKRKFREDPERYLPRLKTGDASTTASESNTTATKRKAAPQAK